MTQEDVLEGRVIAESGGSKFIWLGWDRNSGREIIQTNQYLITNGDDGILLDPGGVHLFSKVVAAASQYIDFKKLSAIFFSHQDPDVSSGVAMWLGLTTAKVYFSNLWLRFLPHFGIFDLARMVGVGDTGGEIPYKNGKSLRMLPAHFLHSPGNLNVWDPTLKVLFSGDLGAAVFPENGKYLFVEDFDRHLPLMEGFHKRYIASNKACRKWVATVRALQPEFICPQHGAIFQGAAVGKFLDWLEHLECGVDIIDSIW